MTVLRTRWGSYAYRFWHRASRPTSPYEKAGYRTKHAAEDAEATRKRQVGYRQRGGDAIAPDVPLALYIGELDWPARRDRERIEGSGWLQRVQRARELAPGSIRNHRDHLHNHVIPALGRLHLRDLTRRHIRELLRAKRQAGLSKDTVRLIRAALSAVLADAEESELIPANPALGLGRRRAREAHKLTAADRLAKIRPMTEKVRDAVLATARTRAPRYALLFELLVKTGLRPSEAFALRPADVDRRRQRVRAERGWTRGEFRPTKTYEQRWVDLPAALARRIGNLKVPDWKSGIPTLLANQAGNPMDISAARKAFRAVLRELKLRELEAAGMTRTIARKELRRSGWTPPHRLYDLRHTYASLRLAAGAPITYVAAQLGHSTPMTTLRHYARWMPTAGRQWVEDD